MTIATREEQIVRIQKASFQAELNEELETKLKQNVVQVVKTTLETALVEEVKAHLAGLEEAKPRRSGYFGRRLDTRFGRIEALSVPKLRQGNKERQWEILTRYQRSRGYLLDVACYLYVMGLSLRDLQEALYLLLGHVVSRHSINQVTVRVQDMMKQEQEAKIERTPPILLVDGVWVSIQYTLDEFKEDQAGHLRQVRHAQERVLLAGMAVWPDGSYEILHYQVAVDENEAEWNAFFEALIKRGLDPSKVELLVSDGTRGLLPVMRQLLPMAKQQRCITHKVRGMKRYLCYRDLALEDEAGRRLTEAEAKRYRFYQLSQDAYAIYDAPSLSAAQSALEAFKTKWDPVEPAAVHAFSWGVQSTFTFYAFRKELRSHIRTTNHLERFFREFRAKSDEIGAFPNETSCLTLFHLVMLRDHAKHDRFSLANN